MGFPVKPKLNHVQPPEDCTKFRLQFLVGFVETATIVTLEDLNHHH